MAVNYNTRIITDGLIFTIDPANKKCYPGSGSSYLDLTNTFSGSTTDNGAIFNSESGGSILYDGTNDTFETSIRAETTIPALSSWTLTCWIKVTNFPTGGATNREGMIFGTAYYTGTGIYFSCTPAGNFRVRGYIRGEDGQRQTNNYSLVLNKTHYLTIVNDRSDTSFKLYIDGELKESISGPTQQYNPTLAIPPNFENIRINRNMVDGGGTQTYTYFQGYSYQANIYNRAVSPQELLQNYNALRGRFGI